MDKGYNLHILQALFKDFLIAEKTSKITMKNYLSDIRHYLSWTAYKFSNLTSNSDLIEDEEIGLIDQFIAFSDKRLVLDYVSHLQANNIPISTINRRLSTLRRFYSFCEKRGILQHNPTHSIRNLGIRVIENTYKTEQNVIEDYRKYLQDNLNDKNISIFLSDFQEIIGIPIDEK